jgi:ABC-2 type transport system permease protein
MTEWVYLATSPFAHVNPYFNPDLITFAALTVIAAAFTAVGVTILRRRDLVPI